MKLTYASLALAALLGAASAQANEFDVIGFGGDTNFATSGTSAGTKFANMGWDNVKIKLNDTATSVSANPWVVRDFTTSSSFIAFCYDIFIPVSELARSLPGPETYNATHTGIDVDVMRLFDLYGTAVSNNFNGISYLVTTPPVTTTNTSTNSFKPGNQKGIGLAAMQLAVWELTVDSDYSLEVGNFQAPKLNSKGEANNSGDALAAINLAQSWLNTLSTQAALPYTGNANLHTLWTATTSPTTGKPVSQPIIQSALVVPEPSSYALVLAGLGVVGFSLRRRHTA